MAYVQWMVMTEKKKEFLHARGQNEEETIK